MTLLLTHGSLLLVFCALVAAGLGIPIPEDLPLLASGTMLHRGVIPLIPTVIVCGAGILIGDSIIFLTASKYGEAALDKRFFAKILPPKRRERMQRFLDKWGGPSVFIARHLAGFRAAVFALSGINGMPYSRFILFDALGMCISAPIMMGIGYFFSSQLEVMRTRIAHGEKIAFALIAIVLSIYFTVHFHHLKKRSDG